MILNKLIFLIGSFFLFYNLVGSARAIENFSLEEREQALIHKLFKTYNQKQKPAGNVNIKFALNLNHIVSVKAKDQIFMLNCFLDHEWVDKRLIWDPKENSNISILRISSEYIWTPDTFIYTTADNTGFLMPQKGAYFVIKNNGKIFWPNPLPQMKVRCTMSIAWFPFDDQICTLIFGSWSHTLNYLNYTLMNENTALAAFTENSEWSLIGYKGFRKEINYDNWIDNFPFSEIHYKILIRRKPLFVLQNYCIPALMLCAITLFSFYMPFAQEMQIGISIMLTFSILKLKLSDDVPSQSDSIPLFNIYFIGCMLISLLALLWFNTLNNLRNHANNLRIPRFIVTRVICYLMCRKNYKKVGNSEIIMKTIETKTHENEDEEDDETLNGQLSDIEILEILNDFIFRLFTIYVLLLNVLLLIIFPYLLKKPLLIEP